VAAQRASAAASHAGDWVSGRSPDEAAGEAAAFRDGLKDVGYIEGRNLAIEYRWAEGRDERLPELAADLVRRQVAVIAAVGGNNSALAAKAATATIPIVFTSGADPVKVGLVAGLNRPGGNVTGVSWFASELGPKQLGLLHELVPSISVAALIVNPNSPELERQPEHAQQAARSLGWQLNVISARSEAEIDAAFAAAVLRHAGGAIVGTDPFFFSRRHQSSREQRSTGCRRSTLVAPSSWPADSSVTGTAFRTPIIVQASKPAAFSRAPCRTICQSTKQPNSSSSSISRPPRHSA
jgi:putative ABC transport system substrate-binding protein